MVREANPEMYWYPYIKRKLEKQKFEVSFPELPHSEKSDIKEWLPFVLNHETIDEDTILVGHSAGCPLILSILENIDCKIKKAILVSGFIDSVKSNTLQDSYDWKKIKSNVEDIIFINSDNDPWKCNDKQGKKMFDKLGGTLIIRSGEGHMGSESFGQEYKKFPFLLKFF